MARILIIGGHGKVALLLAPILVARGDEVTGVIRDPQQSADVAAASAQPLVADIETLDLEGFSDLVRGYDAVVWSAGAGGGNPARTFAVDRDAAQLSMQAAEQAGVPRYVMVSYFRSSVDHATPADHSFFPYAEAKAAADASLRQSSLAWTIVAPSALTLDEPTGRIDVLATESGSVSRADVAAVVAAVLENPSTAGRTIRFNAGDVPIAQALDS